MKTVRINRKQWLRGNGHNVLWSLIDDAGCCLGHVCKQISRKTEKELCDRHCPYEVFRGTSILTDYIPADDYRKILDTSFNKVINNEFANDAIDINDHPLLTEKQREAKLIQLFKENDIKLEFYG